MQTGYTICHENYRNMLLHGSMHATCTSLKWPLALRTKKQLKECSPNTVNNLHELSMWALPVFGWTYRYFFDQNWMICMKQ